MTQTNQSDPRDPRPRVATDADILVDTGITGRPRRGRYSKAAMLADIVSLTDPRLWPVYTAGAFMAAVPIVALVQALAPAPGPELLAGGNPVEEASTDWRTPEETMTLLEPQPPAPFEAPVPQLASTTTLAKPRVTIFGATDTVALAARKDAAKPAVDRR